MKHMWRWVTKSVVFCGLSLAAVLGVAGCGGSGDGEAPADNGTLPTTYIAPASLSAGYAVQMYGRYGLMNTYVINSSTGLTELAANRYGHDTTYSYTYTRLDERRATLVIRTGPDSDWYWELTFQSSSGGLQENGAARTYRDGLLVNTAGVWAGRMTYGPRP